jgi:hypothetical protein
MIRVTDYQKAMDVLNEVHAELVGRPPKWRYYKGEKWAGGHRYCRTIEKDDCDLYYTWIYRRSGRTYKMVKKQGHRRKKDAIARQNELYNEDHEKHREKRSR